MTKEEIILRMAPYAAIGLTIIIIIVINILLKINQRRISSAVLRPDYAEATMDEAPVHNYATHKNIVDGAQNRVISIQHNSIEQSVITRPEHTAETKFNTVFDCLQGLPDNLSGYFYQIQLFTLYAIKNTKLAITDACQYELATEVKDLIPFDDIYLKKFYNGRREFVQVKQTKKPESNTINHSNFFTMLKSEKNIRVFLKGNDTIVKIFMQYEKIKETLCKDADGKFIYCTNTNFSDISSPCFKRVDAVNNDLLCGLKREEWCVDPDYLYMEIIFVLLNIMQNSQHMQLIMDEEYKGELNKQIKILAAFKTDNIDNKKAYIWPLKRIATDGYNIITKRLELLNNSKAKIKKSSNSDNLGKHLPEDCDVVHTDNLEVLKKRATTKIDEVRKTLNSDKDIFNFFSQYDEIKIKNNINTFESNFRIFTSCPTSDVLDDIITNEIADEFNVCFPRLIYAYCLQHISKWVIDFKNGEGKKFTDVDGKQLFSKIWLQLFNDFNKCYIEELEHCNFQFEECNQTLKNFLSNENNTKMLHVSTQNSRIHTLKIFMTLKMLRKKSSELDYLNNIVFTSTEIIKTKINLRNFLCEFKLNENRELLVIECINDIEDFQKISDDLTIIIKNQKKKLIMISSNENRFVTTLKHVIKDHLLDEDVVTLQNFKQATQETILNKTVYFRNNPTSQKIPLKVNDFIAANETTDEETLSILVSNTEDINIGNNYAFVSNEYNQDLFIPRQIVNIDIRVLEDVGDDLFFITGISQEHLASKILLKEEIQIWEQGKSFYKGILVMPDFNKINANTNKVIFSDLSSNSKNSYWFEFQGDFLYKKGVSRGSENNLEEKLKHYKHAPEQITSKIIIVANNPGEGKSTMLTHLAHSLKNESSHYWIIRINLRKYADSTLPFSLKDISSHICNYTKKAVKFVSLMVVEGANASSKLERKFLQKVLSSDASVRIKVVLLFDGYDEISSDFKENTCNLLRALGNSNIKQLWVTTRVHLKEYLEERLQVPAHMMISFNRTEQELVIRKFWAWHLNNYNNKEEQNRIMTQIIQDVHTYVDQIYDRHGLQNTCLTNSESSILPIKNEKLFENIVLEIFAKISLHNWKKAIKKEDFFKVPLNLAILAKNTTKKKLDVSIYKDIQLYDIYEEFIQNKFNTYLKFEFTEEHSVSVDMEEEEMTAVTYRKMHREVAVRTLFEPSHLLPDINICQRVKIPLMRLMGGGLITHNGNRLDINCTRLDQVEFIHRSFAEYFFSEYIVTHIENKLVILEFLGKILLNDDFHLVRKFVDGFLSKCHSSVPQFLNCRDRDNQQHKTKIVKEILRQENKFQENAIPIVVREGLVHIYCLIFSNVPISQFRNLIRKKSREGYSVFSLAIANEDTRMFKTIVGSIQIIKERESYFQLWSPTQNMLKEILLQYDNDENSVLHLSLILGLTEISFHILELLKNCKSEIQILILKSNANKKSLLHLAVSSGNTEICNLIMEILEKNCLHGIPKHCVKQTLFFRVIKFIRTNILWWESGGKVDFKRFLLQADMYGMTALHLATENGHVEICRLLLTTAAKYSDLLVHLISEINTNSQNALHVGAFDGHTEICKLILKTAEENNCLKILPKDELHKSKVKPSDEIVKNNYFFFFFILFSVYFCLAKVGVKIAIMYLICSIIMVYFTTGTEEPTTTTLDSEITEDSLKPFILQADIYGMTSLHVATKEGHVDICRLILTITARHSDLFIDLLSKINMEGRTALHIGAFNGQSEICGLILKITEENNGLNPLDEPYNNYTKFAHSIIVFSMIIVYICHCFHNTKFLLIHDFESIYDYCGLVFLIAFIILFKRIIFVFTIRVSNEEKVPKLDSKITEYLLTYILQTDISGMTALHIATEKNHLDICRLLLITAEKRTDLCIDLISKTNNEGQTALHIGALNGQTEICELILKTAKKHCDTLQNFISRVDRSGKTALNLAEASGNKECYDVILRDSINIF